MRLLRSLYALPASRPLWPAAHLPGILDSCVCPIVTNKLAKNDACARASLAGPYSTYEGSPVSKGILQPDMWGVKPSDRWDWDVLRRDIAQASRMDCNQGTAAQVWLGAPACVHRAATLLTPACRPCPPRAALQNGVRNSLLVAPMPTASTSQILGNNECFEPYTSNIYVRRVLSGVWG